MMSVAYNSKNLTFPLSILMKWFCYDTTGDLRKDCQYYGLQVIDDAVCFRKSDFDDSKNTVIIVYLFDFPYANPFYTYYMAFVIKVDISITVKKELPLEDQNFLQHSRVL